MGTRNTTWVEGFLGALSVWDGVLPQLWHLTVLAAFCMLHGHKDWAKEAAMWVLCRSPETGVPTHPSDVDSHVLLDMFPPKLVAKTHLASATIGNMYRLAMKSTPKLRTRYNEPCYCSGMKIASVTVMCWPENIFPGTSGLHRGMSNAARNFSSRILLGTQLFISFASWRFLCS